MKSVERNKKKKKETQFQKIWGCSPKIKTIASSEGLESFDTKTSLFTSKFQYSPSYGV